MTRSTATSLPVLGDATIQELRESLRGTVVTPTDAMYDEARAVWNGDIDRRPGLVVRCAGPADVATVLRFAQSEGREVAVRGGGHNVSGFGTSDGGIVVDLSPMKGITVDPAAKLVRAQGGVVWKELDHETQAHGLATTGGLVSSTGIAGFTLGGGIGWLMRRHGLAADNLLACDVVTADGEFVRTSEHEHPDLFWALRGGGGNFGVVTSFEYRLHPVGPSVYGGAVFHRAERAGELLAFYRDWVADLPDELTTMLTIVTAPPEPFVPDHLVGRPVVAVACCHIGDHADAEAILAPLRAVAPAEIDLLGPIPYVALQSMFDDSAPHGLHAYWKTMHLDALSDDAIDTIVDRCSRLPTLSPFSALHLHHVGGAVSRVAADATAIPHRSHPFVLNILGNWQADDPRATHVDWVRATFEAMRVHGVAAPYLNFLADEGDDSVHAAYGADTYRRLSDLKSRYDPRNVFHLNQNILPEASRA